MVLRIGHVGILVITVCLTAHATVAQSRISYHVVTATSALTNIQQQDIDRYLTDKIKQLTFGTPDEVVKARHELIEPLTWAGGTEIFHLAYSTAVSLNLTQAMNSQQLHVRLNAMIVLNSLNAPGIVNLIQIGLADKSPAIRYWAGKAVNQTIANRLSIEEQKRLLTALSDALLKEKSERVLQRLLIGLVGLNIPEAAVQLLGGLNKRVKLHVDNPNMPLGAALEGLRTLFVKMVQAKANRQDIPIDTIRYMALVAYRYFILSATLLDTNRTSQENHNHYQEMIRLADAILGWTTRQMPPETSQLPPSVKDELTRANWPLIRLRAEEWKSLLTQAPFNFGPVDLMVAIPDYPQ